MLLFFYLGWSMRVFFTLLLLFIVLQSLKDILFNNSNILGRLELKSLLGALYWLGCSAACQLFEKIVLVGWFWNWGKSPSLIDCYLCLVFIPKSRAIIFNLNFEFSYHSMTFSLKNEIILMLKLYIFRFTDWQAIMHFNLHNKIEQNSRIQKCIRFYYCLNYAD